MTSLSTAIGIERKARTSGYEIKKGFFSDETGNLPQVIGILAQANTSNQASISTDKRELTSAEEAGELYGYGSPIHQIMRILRPKSGDGVGGIPTIVYPQIEDETMSETVIDFTVSGDASNNATHTVRIAGRESIDFKTYSYSIKKGDSSDVVAQKIADTVNDNLSSPVIATVVGSTVTFTTKWKGETSAETKIEFNNNQTPVGLTYAKTNEVLGSGIPDLSTSFEQLGDDWVTAFINSYSNDTVFGLLEALNGKPSTSTPTGRYSPPLFKPFMAYFGSTESNRNNLVSITDAPNRVEEVTNVLCPAPNSQGYTWEAAANAVYWVTRVAQDSPELDTIGYRYPDMPTPFDGLIGDMSDYNNRDFLIKNGCSAVTLKNGAYEIEHLVTTYHPEGEDPLLFSYCRDLMIDWNVYDAYNILEKTKLIDKVIVGDNQLTNSGNTVKPKEFKADVFNLFDNLGLNAIINDVDFSKQSLRVKISETNPNRFETFFRYKRTGIARITSTTVEAGF